MAPAGGIGTLSQYSQATSGKTLGSGSFPAIAVLGPTGSGKSELGLLLAEEIGGEIVSCDSIQVFRGLDVGSAKVPVAMRRGIRHHLIDVIGAGEELTAGAYSRLARDAIAEIGRNGRIPVIVGGTGFYLRALLDGLVPAPARNEALRSRLADLVRRRPGALHRFLRRYDSKAAARIHSNDHQKLIRAIELTILTRQPVSETQSLPRASLEGVKALKIGLMPARNLLYQKLNDRSAWMFHNGLLKETGSLLAAGLDPESKPLQSLGYKQAVRVLAGQCSLDDAILECQIRTRQYAKRQITWFRGEPGIVWLDGFGWQRAIQEQALELSKSFLERFGNSLQTA